MILAVACCLAGNARLPAATITFNANAALDNLNNWSPAQIPVTTDEALFTTVPAANANLTMTGSSLTFGDLIWNQNTSSSITINTTTTTSRTLTLSGGGGSTAAIAAGGASGDLLVMGTNATSNTLTIGGNLGTGSGRLNLALGASGNFDVVNAGATLSITGIVSGAFRLTKTGAGKLVLSGINTYSGGTTITGGTLVMTSPSNLGATPGSADTSNIIIDGGTLEFTADIVSPVLSANRGIRFGNSGGTIMVDAGKSVVIGGSMRDITSTTGSLIKTGDGTLTLNGPSSSYTGGTTVNAGTLILGSAVALGATTGGLTVNAGSLDLNGRSFTVGAFSGSGGSITNNVTGSVTLTAGDSSNTSFAGIFQDGAGSLGLTKQGAGTLALSGASTITGDVNVNNGTLLAKNSSGSATGSGNVTVQSSASLGGSGVVGLATGTQNITVSGGATLLVGDTTGAVGTAKTLDLKTSGSGVIRLGGTAELDIFSRNAGTNSTTNNDLLRLASDQLVSIDGTLKVVDITGTSSTAWAAGDAWQLFDWTNVTSPAHASGSFTTLVLPTLAGGLGWDTSALFTTGFISVTTAVPEPGRMSCLLVAAGATVLRRRRK